MCSTRTKTEGRVNIPLGERKKELEKMAAKEGITETALARIILIQGLEAIKAGDAVFSGPKLIPAKGKR